MHSNNDGMPPDWKPSDSSEFENFMNQKKLDYMNTRLDMFNYAHVTNWASEYVLKLEVENKHLKAAILEAIRAPTDVSRMVADLKMAVE